MQRRILLTWAAALGFFTSSSQAQLPISRPAGVIIKTIKGGGGFTSIGVPFTREPAARAVLNSVSGNTLNAEGTPFSAGTYSATPHSVMFLTGPNRGKAIRIAATPANTTSAVTLSSAPPAGLVAADEFYVIPEFTLGTLFGTGANPSGLLSSTDSSVADIIRTTDNAGNLVAYYHNGTFFRRVTGSPASANNVSVGGLNGGVLVEKRSAGDINFEVKGTLRSGRQDDTLIQGFNMACYTDVGGATLITSGLFPGVLTANSDSALADIVYVADASGALVQYYHNGTNFRRVTGAPTSQNNLPVRPESVLLINKRSAGVADLVIDEQFVP